MGEAPTRRQQIERQRRVAHAALGEFGLRPASLTLMSHFHNTTFRVRDENGACYVLRIHRAGETPLDPVASPARVQSELWWLERLGTDLHLPLPAPVHTPGGANVISIEDGPVSRLCVLFRWMDGRFLWDGLRPRHLASVGRLTARLHNYSTRLEVPDWFTRGDVDRTDREMARYAVDLFRERWSAPAAEVIAESFRRVQRTKQELGNGPDVRGLVHGDIHQWNYFFSGGEARLIDFDDSGWGHYLYDSAVTIHQMEGHPRHSGLRAAYLAGYREVRALSPVEESAIEDFIALRRMQDITWFLQERGDEVMGRPDSLIAENLSVLKRLLAEDGSRRSPLAP